MRFKRTLEAILATVILFATFAMPKKAKAAAETFIVPSDSNNVTQTTITENYSAWADSGNIVVFDRTKEPNDSNAQYTVNNSGEANSPNLDMENLVYEQAGSVWWHDLNTIEKFCVFPASSYGTCRYPKINGTNIVFRLDTATGQEIWGADVSRGMDARNIRFFPITHSKNRKGEPDIYGDTVVWPELVNKPHSGFDVNDLLSYGPAKFWIGFIEPLYSASEPNDLLNNEDWDIHGYYLSTGQEFIINNEPNISTDSVAIYGNMVAYSWNTCIDGPTGITFYYPSINKHRRSLPGPRGSIHNMRLHKNVASWTRKWARFRYQPPFNNKDRIEAMYVLPIGIKSDGYRVNDEGGRQFGSDSFKNTEQDYIVSYATTDSNFPSASASSMSASSITDPYSSEPTSAAVIKTFRDALFWDLKEVYDNWLKVKKKGSLFNPRGDFNNDGRVNFLDIAKRIEAEKIIKETQALLSNTN